MAKIAPEEAQQYIAAISNKTDKGQLFRCNTHFLFKKLKGIVKPLNQRRYQCRGELFECLIDSHRCIGGQWFGAGCPVLQKLTEQEINDSIITEND